MGNLDTEAICSLVLRDYEVRGLKTIANVRSRSKHLVRLLDDPLSRDAIEDYMLARRREGAKPGSIRNELIQLRRGLRLAKGRGLIEDIPAFSLPEVRNVRMVFASAREVARIIRALEVLSQDTADVITWMAITGWRISEACGLRWEDVTPDLSRVSLPDTKTGPRETFCGEALRAILEKRRVIRRKGCPFVFHRQGKRIKYLYGRWRQAVQSVGRPELRPHDLRRTFAQLGIDEGVAIPTLMKTAGWRTMSTFLRYSIVSRPAVEDAQAKIAARLVGDS